MHICFMAKKQIWKLGRSEAIQQVSHKFYKNRGGECDGCKEGGTNNQAGKEAWIIYNRPSIIAQWKIFYFY